MKGAGINVPDFTTDINDAKRWIAEDKIVFCRTLLRANSGRGIVIAKVVAELVRAPLYVKYIRKEKEYRLHVFNGKVIDLVEKRRRTGFQEATNYNKYVRSYEQGWIMARDGVVVTEETRSQAIRAVQALGLDFGAVDIVMDRNGKPMILEVNTAPGIQGTTLDNYKKAVQQWMMNLR
jgi:D-alanine-D-alanine ligase-like ATP-grasp enzyme